MCFKTLFLCLALLPMSVLAMKSPKYDIIVDRNGRGHFRNIQQAIDSLQSFNSTEKITIFVRVGTYKEKLELPDHVCNFTLIGENIENTIITYDDHAKIENMGTFKTYTFLIRGNDITLEYLTIENSSLPLAQAVALHIEGDKIIFRRCRFLGHQDTIFAGRKNTRQYFEDCYIEGTTDFIFGISTCWFERCEIHCKKNSYITAASTPQYIQYGFIFNNCKVTLAKDVSKVYLGRPWRGYAMTLFMDTELPEGIRMEGWHNWGQEENEKTARFMEYNNIGKGANVEKRVPWSKILSEDEAKKYTIENIMKGNDNWNPLNNE